VKWKCKSNVKEEILNSLLDAGACGRIYALEECAMREIIRCSVKERKRASDKSTHRISSLWVLDAKKRDCARAMAKKAALFLFQITRDKILLSFYWATVPSNMKSGLAKAATAVAVN
jgi:hypothetical protein